MRRFRSLPRRRLILLALAAAAIVVMLALTLPPHAAAIVCPPGDYVSGNVTYYNDADHDTIVGHYYGCTGDLIGQSTNYYTRIPVCCPGN